MGIASSGTETSGTVTMERDFDQFYRHLCNEFPEPWSLPRLILNELNGEHQAARLDDLIQMAHRQSGLPQSAQTDAFLRKVVRQAIYILRAAALSLYVDGKNRAAFTLTPENEVKWTGGDDRGMKRVMERKNLQEVPGEEADAADAAADADEPISSV